MAAVRADKARLLPPANLLGPNEVVLPRVGRRNGQAMITLLNPRAASLTIANMEGNEADAVRRSIHVNNRNPQRRVQKSSIVVLNLRRLFGGEW